MQVRLISKTVGVDGQSPEEMIGYCARVSNPSNQDNPNVEKLLKFCFKHGHFSIFEMADYCFEIKTSRAIAAQILRHRHFNYQEFCIAGDSLISTITTGGNKKRIRIDALYEKQFDARFNRKIKVYDETTKQHTYTNLVEVFKTGVKPVFRVTLDNGKSIKSTKEHKFYRLGEWVALEDVSVGDFLGTNGLPLHQSADYYAAAKDKRMSLSEKLRGFETDGCCSLCPSTDRLQHDHIIPVSVNPLKAQDLSNIRTLCASCNVKEFDRFRTTMHYSRVVSIDYVGEEETYDLEVSHLSHNYVANGISVHNSQRYSAVQSFEKYEARMQDEKNKQNSLTCEDSALSIWFKWAQNEVVAKSQELYNKALEAGIAKEQARFLLPMTVETTMYMKGSLRSWIHYLSLRRGPETQKEHRDIANAIYDLLLVEAPNVMSLLPEYNSMSSNPYD